MMSIGNVEKILGIGDIPWLIKLDDLNALMTY